jgi:hypothetical protein
VCARPSVRVRLVSRGRGAGSLCPGITGGSRIKGDMGFERTRHGGIAE